MSMKTGILEVLRFSVVAHKGSGGHDRMEMTAHLNCDFERHLKICTECRNVVLKDLRDFVAQTERELTQA